MAKRSPEIQQLWALLWERQDGKCAICSFAFRTKDYGGTFMEWPRLDHDHNCCQAGCFKCVRGLLCGNCNCGLSYFQDDPGRLRNAAEYLTTNHISASFIDIIVKLRGLDTEKRKATSK